MAESYSVWLIKEGEPLPLKGDERLMRTGSLAAHLANQGHRVTWWSSTYSHANKEYVSHKHSLFKVSDQETLVLLHSPISYKRNKSLARMEYHARLSREFRRHSGEMEKPDVIVCSWPTPQFAREAVRYGQVHDVPVVIDVRDLWPDIYYRAAPAILEYPAKYAISLMRRAASKTMSNATAIVGMNDAAVEWGCKLAGRKRGDCDRTVFIGAKCTIDDGESDENARLWWTERGIVESTWNVCLFSTLSNQLDLRTAIKAVEIVARDYPHIRLVIGGRGDEEEHYKSFSDGIEQVVFAGWLDDVQMASLMRISTCGMYCIRNTEDFVDTFSNKAIQYLSGGLPILNSLSGFAHVLIEEYGCGLSYAEGDAEDCANKLRFLIENEGARKQMSLQAKELFSSKFELSIINGQFEELITQIAERNIRCDLEKQSIPIGR